MASKNASCARLLIEMTNRGGRAATISPRWPQITPGNPRYLKRPGCWVYSWLRHLAVLRERDESLFPEDNSHGLSVCVETRNKGGLMATPAVVNKQGMKDKIVHRCPPDPGSYSDLRSLLLHYYYYYRIYRIIYTICFSHSFSRGFWLASSGQGTKKRELNIYSTMWMFSLISAWRWQWAPPPFHGLPTGTAAITYMEK